MARFSGQVAVVTGAARGIGQAIAKRLADDGAQVYGLDVQDFVASDAAITPRHVDVRDAESIQHTVNDIMGRLGRIDVWVNNAGVYSNGSIQAMSISDWRMALDINLTGAMCCIQAVVPPMIAQHYGRIVNISSIAGLIGFPESIAYGTTKTALIGLTRAAAVDLGPYGITVNAICPGSILTEMQMQVDLAISTRNGWPPGTFNTQRTAEIPLRRLGNPEDVAGVVAFLASPDAAYMTGQTLIVDGGLMPI